MLEIGTNNACAAVTALLRPVLALVHSRCQLYQRKKALAACSVREFDFLCAHTATQCRPSECRLERQAQERKFRPPRVSMRELQPRLCAASPRTLSARARVLGRGPANSAGSSLFNACLDQLAHPQPLARRTLSRFLHATHMCI